jgi:hypothetical protein
MINFSCIKFSMFLLQDWISGTPLQIALKLNRLKVNDESIAHLVSLLQQVRTNRDRDKACAAQFRNVKAKGDSFFSLYYNPIKYKRF